MWTLCRLYLFLFSCPAICGPFCLLSVHSCLCYFHRLLNNWIHFNRNKWLVWENENVGRERETETNCRPVDVPLNRTIIILLSQSPPHRNAVYRSRAGPAAFFALVSFTVGKVLLPSWPFGVFWLAKHTKPNTKGADSDVYRIAWCELNSKIESIFVGIYNHVQSL